MRHPKKAFLLPCVGFLAGITGNPVFATVVIYGGGTFTGGPGGTGGISAQSIQLSPGVALQPGGVALARGTGYYYSGSSTAPTSDNNASFIFTSTGLTSLGSLGTQADGNPNSTFAYALNSSGASAGYTANQSFSVITAVLWDSSGNPTALQPLTTSSTGGAAAFGYAINDSGTVAGSSTVYSGSTSLGGRPAFWAAGSTTPTALGIYGTGTYFGTANSNVGSVQSINSAGTMVGADEMFGVTGGDLGPRATFWSAGGSAANELPHFASTGPGGSVSSYARIINNAGVVGGYSTNYSTPGTPTGQIPVRWIPSAGSYTLQVLQTAGAFDRWFNWRHRLRSQHRRRRRRNSQQLQQRGRTARPTPRTLESRRHRAYTPRHPRHESLQRHLDGFRLRHQ